MPNQSKSREMMFSKVREWQGSGLSQKAFCEQHKITYSNFHYWYKRFRHVDQPASSGFVPMQISDISSDIFASIIFSSGHTLQLPQALRFDYLKELIG